ncbi:MAG TPA: class I SAM-dependent methyltransferase [Candidatus Acidoferrales bacterium]
MGAKNYTFGDTGEASVRLRRLAELYEPESRELLTRGECRSPRVAVDLGCGPGWTTRLVHDVLEPRRTVGIDASARFIDEARINQRSELEFYVGDVTQGRFPVAAPDALFCRFLLTHLAQVREALAAWAKAAAPGATLFIHETESLETENPAMDRYYEHVAQLQEHYGQTLYMGGLLTAFIQESGWRIVENRHVILEKPAQKMAELHLSNLRTWRSDKFAKEAFDVREVDALEKSLERIVNGEDDAGVIVNAARQIIARRA